MEQHPTALARSFSARHARLRGRVMALLLAVAPLQCAEVTPPENAPNIDLQIGKVTSHATRAPGEQVIFTVTVRNNGPLVATGVLAGDTLPDGLTYVSHTTTVGTYAPGSGLWTIGNLGIDEEAILTVTASMDAGTTNEGLINQAGVLSADMNDTVETNNVSEAGVVRISNTPPPAGIFFTSTWGTATGSSDNAISDGGKYNNMYCSSRSQTLTVIAGSSVGFTKTPNVLRLQQLGPSVCGMLEATNAIPQSTSHWGRMYFRNDDIGSQHNHVATYWPVGEIQLAFWNRQGQAGGLRVFIRTFYHGNGSPTAYPTNVWTLVGNLLQHNTWYRYEWHMEYVTATTYRIWPRIYDMSGTLIKDASNFFQNDASATSGLNLANWYAAGNTFGFSNVSLARNFGIGNEGPSNSPATNGYWYHADIALSTSGWIGQ